jgi:hypothetical protein
MRSFSRWAAVAAVVVMAAVPSALPAQTYVGSWSTSAGPGWMDSPPNGPRAYTGQEAAALLFGGSPFDYWISTIDDQAAHIDHLAWYSIIGVTNSHALPENYFSKYLGEFYGPTVGYAFGDLTNPASAYVADNTLNADNPDTNYAFLIDQGQVVTPEPASVLLLASGLAGVAGALRRRRSQG